MGLRQGIKIGDLVKIVEDPLSFVIGEKLFGSVGIIVDYDESTQIYTVFISEHEKTIRVLDFMMEKCQKYTCH